MHSEPVRRLGWLLVPQPNEDRVAAGTTNPEPTPLLELAPGLLIKFECNNPGGSHKVRAARHIVRCAIRDGDIIPGRTTVIEKTGGNFGFGLTVACAESGVPVELAVGLGFSPIKRRLLGECGAKLIGIDMLTAGASPREVVEWHLARALKEGKHYFYSDQFSNRGSVEAHELETGPEIVAQLQRWPEIETVVFVSCAGTGASLTGVARSLRAAGLETQVVLVEPEGCDSRRNVFVQHSLEGMSVGVVPPFVDWTLLSDIRHVTPGQVDAACQRFARQHGFLIGKTSAACLAIASELARDSSARRKVLAMIYDHGLWYVPASV